MEQENTQLNSYLSFNLDTENFAINVGKVLSILELSRITKIPRAPEYLKGVINLRGEVLPVTDTKVKFGMGDTEFTTNTCILVLDLVMDSTELKVGVLVDNVREVFEIDNAEILPPPSIGSKYKSDFISGICRRNDDFVMILDIEKIFSSDELLMLTESSNTPVEETDEAVEKK